MANVHKSQTRKDKYGNPLYDDEAFMAGYKAGKKYLDNLLEYNSFESLKKSNVFVMYLVRTINEGIFDSENDFYNNLDPNFTGTYQDLSEIIGAITGEEIDASKDWMKCWTGKAYTGYKPAAIAGGEAK